MRGVYGLIRVAVDGYGHQSADHTDLLTYNIVVWHFYVFEYLIKHSLIRS
jgi:hypothetical protein